VSKGRTAQLGWYARRLARMSPAEMVWRARDHGLQAVWSRRQVRREQIGSGAAPPGARRFTSALVPHADRLVPVEARAAVLAAADQLLRGEWEVLGIVRTDLLAPDWFSDPVSGRRAPADRYAFSLNSRSEEQTGNIKQIWEISRLQHLTLLATAWFLSRNEEYARLVADQLDSWWRENPFLSGVHWTSGIEVGIRLISFAWIRRLLHEWPPVADHFENNKLAARQIWWHQLYLAAFRSRGSSANNHVIAESAGLLVASCAFPWYAESDRWRRVSARLLERELIKNTFPSGIGRELATDYQCFVAELGMLAAVEAQAAGRPLSPALWQRLCAMVDSGAALLDQSLRAPRQGDGDDGRALLLDAPAANRWPSLLALGAALFGPLSWWPALPPDAASSIISAMPGATHDVAGRPERRPWRFADAGTTLLRTTNKSEPEIWCRCDGGPHGYLSIAAHAHADALSVELRYGGVDILADPGTYCYHGEPEWRSYFRSTIAHNTVELDGRSQSSEGGPFLWVRHANARELDVQDIGDAVEWTAEHDGYGSLHPPSQHRRTARLDRASRCIDIIDEISSSHHDVRLAFHLGPQVEASLDGTCALLQWPFGSESRTARLELPGALRWSLHRGETSPILGWYSRGLGRRFPAITLLGQGGSVRNEPLITRLQFLDIAAVTDRFLFAPALSRIAADAAVGEPGHMETGMDHSLDLRRSLEIVRRHLAVIWSAAALGLIAGGAYVGLSRPVHVSTALVVLPSMRSASAEVVVASSYPVLRSSLSRIHPAESVQGLRSRIQVTKMTTDVISITAEGGTDPEAEGAANAVADSYVAYIGSANSPVGRIPAQVLVAATTAHAPSVLLRSVAPQLAGLMLGTAIGVIGVLAIGRKDRRLRQRDGMADAIGVPVLASIWMNKPTDAAGWIRLLESYEPSPADAWRLRNVLNDLKLTDGAPGDQYAGCSVTVLSLASDQRALAIGPQLAAFAAALGIPTALVIGPRQDTAAEAALYAAAVTPSPSMRSGRLRLSVWTPRGESFRRQDGVLTVVVAVVTETSRAVALPPADTRVLAVSAGAVTAAQLARVALAATADGGCLAGILIGDPEPDDPTTGRLPQLARPNHSKFPSRLTAQPR